MDRKHRFVKKRDRTKTYQYVLDNDMVNVRCNRCGSVVLRETFVEGYPYQCMECDENLYGIETHIGAEHTRKELDRLVQNTARLLCLDD